MEDKKALIQQEDKERDTGALRKDEGISIRKSWCGCDIVI